MSLGIELSINIEEGGPELILSENGLQLIWGSSIFVVEPERAVCMIEALDAACGVIFEPAEV